MDIDDALVIEDDDISDDDEDDHDDVCLRTLIDSLMFLFLYVNVCN